MNDQSQMMSSHQAPPPQQSVVPPPPPQLMSQPPVPMMMQSQPISMGMVPIAPPQMMLGHSQGMMMMNNIKNNNNNNNNVMNPNLNPSQRGYKPWQQNPMKFNKKQQQQQPQPRTVGGSSSNWKGKMGKPINANVGFNNTNNSSNPNLLSGVVASGSGTGGYKPPSLNELQNQNRMKARKYYHPKKRFNPNANANARFAPYAPRNTTSFIIRAKRAGGIAELVSPCPVTPAVLPTPIFSPSREMLGDMAKEEWGVDGYGSMKGLIRLRSPTGNDAEGVHDDEEDDEGNGSSESDVEEHVEVERRLDHDLSRFEMIYPSTHGIGYGGEYGYNNVLENRVDDQDTHIAQLEEENLTLKERLFLMERELGDLRRRLQFLERRHGGRHGDEFMVDVGEEVVENVYENDENENESDGGSDVGPTMGVENNAVDVMDYDNETKRESNEVAVGENLHDYDEGILKTENTDGNQEKSVKEDEDAVMLKEKQVKSEEVVNEVGLVYVSSKQEADIHKQEDNDGSKIKAEGRVVDAVKNES